MSAKAVKKKIEPENEKEFGLWVDTALIARLLGRRSSPLGNPLSLNSESQRLLHYADVMLGTDKKEKFVSAKPTKKRKK